MLSKKRLIFIIFVCEWESYYNISNLYHRQDDNYFYKSTSSWKKIFTLHFICLLVKKEINEQILQVSRIYTNFPLAYDIGIRFNVLNLEYKQIKQKNERKQSVLYRIYPGVIDNLLGVYHDSTRAPFIHVFAYKLP